MLVKYLVQIDFSDTVSFGLREKGEYYYLDMLISGIDDKKLAFNKYKTLKSEYKDILKTIDYSLNDKYSLIIKHIISQFLLNVK